jgi:iterative type I PKS product template protein
VRAFGPGRINYHFGFSGPSFSVDTACSSSMAAIQLACTSLRARDCDTVFAGGMNVMTNPDIFSGLSKGQFLSKTGSCKTYDDGADGYCRGDGVVTLILKRLEDAVAEKDPILGVIAGIATNHSAEAVSITHPHVGAQQFLFQKVMDEANVDVRSVGYVEMHGTGTQAGDGVEMASVSSVFAPSDKRKRRADQPLVVGSVKANIGHGEAVSGACALVKTMMMFKKSMIPPHCGIKTQMNRGFAPDLKDRNLNIVFKPTPFIRKGDAPRYIFMNNFSAAGGNTATLIEDAPVPKALIEDPRKTHAIVVSAKSLASFKANIQKLLSWVKDQPDSRLPSLAYTTTARRAHFQYRVAFEATSMDQVRGTLNSLAQFPRQPVSSTKPSTGFVFTGQGSHYLGMGQKLFENVEQFRLDIQDFNQIACNNGFPSFLGIIDGTATDMENISPVSTQLAITCSQIALSRLWKSWGISPSVVIGHSLGEYAALHVAGVLSIYDTIYLVGRRAELLVSSCRVGTHGMLAVRAEFSSVVPLLSNTTVERACINGPDDIVFSGTTEHIDRLKDTLTSQGVKNTKLSVPYAFHSSQVEPILEPFKESAKSIIFHKPQIPVISTLLGTVVSEHGTFGAEYLARHCRESVNFFGGLNAALQQEIIDESTTWVELGPHPICSPMIKRVIGRDVVAVPALHREQSAWKTAASSLSILFNAGLNLDWSGYHHEFSGAHEVLSLPSYSFDEKVYWIQYKGNWTLTKGEAVPLALTNAKQGFSTTSVQRIVAETFDAQTALVTAESDLTEPLLRAAITGHVVNGVGLCPSSIYADMAMTICDYAYKGANPGAASPHWNVCNMETHKPLVLNSNDAQVLQIETTLDLVQSRAVVTFKSKVGDNLVDQAKCNVIMEDASIWTKDWERRKFLVQGRVDLLKAGGKGIHHIHRGLAYKLFSALVQYDDKYRGMEEVILSSEGLEATSRVQFQATAQDGKFVMSPYFLDSVCHISGFIMNANDAVDSQKHVYISHGWESMRFSKVLDANTQYASYVKMQPVPGAGQMVAGDVYIFEGNDIIGVVGGLKFQCVPRVLLSTLLSTKSKPAASSRTVMLPQVQQTQVVQTVSKTQTQTQTQTIKKSLKADAGLTIQSRGALTGKALDIIAEEVGCEVVELQGAIGLADLGIDSLMSLSISGRFREELGLDFRSEVFNEMPTVGDLKKYLQQFETTIDAPSSSGISTPDMVSSDGSDDEDNFELVDTSPLDDTQMINIQDPLVHTIRSIIAQEMGVDIEEISDNTDLSTMGMDSLMSLSILGALREQTGLKMHSDLLVDNTSIEKIETSLGLRAPKTRTVTKQTKSKVTPTTTSFTNVTNITNVSQSVQTVKFHTDINVASYPPAKSILLQGDPKTATRTLFLLPDGSGSATSYATIPDLAPADLCVYGLNCPFMKDPESFTIGVAGVTQIYMAEIQRRQPKGPYLLGGWSAGGVLAYEMTRQFIAKGEEVKKLVLIDSPCPIGLESLPATFHRFCDSIGLLGKGDPAKTPKWLLPHFAASVRELTAFSESLDDQLAHIDVSKMPETICIWAKEGVVQPGMKQPDWPAGERMPNSMYWLVNDRSDFSPNGWQRLVGSNVKCVVTNGNHFSMMKDPIVSGALNSHTSLG